MLRRIIRVSGAILCLFVVLWGAVNEVRAQSSHDQVKKYVDEETVLVAWSDISAVDVAELNGFLDEQFKNGMSPESLKRTQAMQQALVGLKVSNVYCLFDLSSMTQGPTKFVIPCENPEAVALLLGVAAEGPFKVEAEKDAVLVGSPEGILRMKLKSDAMLPTLRKAMDNVDGKHGVAFATPAPVSRALLQVLQASMKPDDFGSMAKVAQALAATKSTSVSLKSLPPKNVGLELQVKSPEAAKEMQAMFLDVLATQLPESANAVKCEVEGASVQVVCREVGMLLPELAKASGANQAHKMNNQKQIALALHNYISARGHLPPQCVVDEEGNRLLSWRVLILPYLEQSNLYQAFRLDEPWDSPHNLKVAQTIPFPFASEDGALDPNGVPLTKIVAPLTEKSAFGKPGKPVGFRHITDGTSNTLWFFESKHDGVPWTKPEDVVVDVEDPKKAIGGEGDFIGSLIDGSVHSFPKDLKADTLNALITINGGEVISDL